MTTASCAQRLLVAALSLAAIPSSVFALQVTPGSSCSAICLDAPTGDPFNPADSTTSRADIVCQDAQYSSTSAGAKYQRCIECLQKSSKVNDTESDSAWLLYNMRYTVGTCMLDYTSEPEQRPVDTVTAKDLEQSDSESEPNEIPNSPCQTQFACLPLKDAILSDDLDVSSPKDLDYCSASNKVFEGSSFRSCVRCLQSSSNQIYLSNFLIALRKACIDDAGPGYILPLNGSLFSTTAVSYSIVDPAANSGLNVENASLSSQENNTDKSSSFTTGAIVGISIGCGLLVVGIVAFIGIYVRSRRQNRDPKTPKKATIFTTWKRSGSKSTVVSDGGEKGNATTKDTNKERNNVVNSPHPSSASPMTSIGDSTMAKFTWDFKTMPIAGRFPYQNSSVLGVSETATIAAKTTSPPSTGGTTVYGTPASPSYKAGNRSTTSLAGHVRNTSHNSSTWSIHNGSTISGLGISTPQSSSSSTALFPPEFQRLNHYNPLTPPSRSSQQKSPTSKPTLSPNPTPSSRPTTAVAADADDDVDAAQLALTNKRSLTSEAHPAYRADLTSRTNSPHSASSTPHLPSPGNTSICGGTFGRGRRGSTATWDSPRGAATPVIAEASPAPAAPAAPVAPARRRSIVRLKTPVNPRSLTIATSPTTLSSRASPAAENVAVAMTVQPMRAARTPETASPPLPPAQSPTVPSPASGRGRAREVGLTVDVERGARWARQ